MVRYKAYVAFETGNGYQPGVYSSWADAKRATEGICEAPQGYRTMDEAIQVWNGGSPENPKAFYVVLESNMTGPLGQIHTVYYRAKLAAGGKGFENKIDKFRTLEEAQAFLQENCGTVPRTQPEPVVSTEPNVPRTQPEPVVTETNFHNLIITEAPKQLVGAHFSSVPLVVCFDVETTGLTNDDQIISMAVVRYRYGVQEEEPFYSRFRPTCEIHPGAQHVHGISLEDLEDENSFADNIKQIYSLFDGADGFIGYNVQFDMNMILREFRRCGMEPPSCFTKVQFIVDPFKIWTTQRPRTLVDAAREFLDEDMENAHDAMADIAATIHVLNSMTNQFRLENTSLEELDGMFRPRDAIDLDGKFCWTVDGKVKICFSGHKGKIVPDDFHDAGFFQWMVDKKSFSPSSELVARIAVEYFYDSDKFRQK